MYDATPEAAFVQSFGSGSVLDAGCGTGRVAIELARRGIEAVGMDIDPYMLRQARRDGPEIVWHLADISRADLHRHFDVVLLAGNVMIFVEPGTQGAVLKNMRRHLASGGLLISGFQLAEGYFSLADYDHLAIAANLELVARFSSWTRAPWTATSNYAISVHRRVDKPR